MGRDATLGRRCEDQRRQEPAGVAIRERLSKFHAQTEPLVPYYTERGILKFVEATDKNPDQTWEAVRAVMG